jgi:hypothetical protein
MKLLLLFFGVASAAPRGARARGAAYAPPATGSGRRAPPPPDAALDCELRQVLADAAEGGVSLATLPRF